MASFGHKILLIRERQLTIPSSMGIFYTHFDFKFGDRFGKGSTLRMMFWLQVKE
jgi:hypothetical protein